jgi:hypothetical protein
VVCTPHIAHNSSSWRTFIDATGGAIRRDLCHFIFYIPEGDPHILWMGWMFVVHCGLNYHCTQWRVRHIIRLDHPLTSQFRSSRGDCWPHQRFPEALPSSRIPRVWLRAHRYLNHYHSLFYSTVWKEKHVVVHNGVQHDWGFECQHDNWSWCGNCHKYILA